MESKPKVGKVWVAWSPEEWGHGVRAAALSKEALGEKLKELFAFASPVAWGPLTYERAPDGLDYSITMNVLPTEHRMGGAMRFDFIEMDLDRNGVIDGNA